MKQEKIEALQVDIHLDRQVVEMAVDLGLDISSFATSVTQSRIRQIWLESRQAEGWEEYIRDNGLPLELEREKLWRAMSSTD